MNFTENVAREGAQEIDKSTSPELRINPRFYGNQSVNNLLDLKLKVHNLLNTPKEKFDEQEVKKLEDDVQNTEAMGKFNQVVGEFSKPSLEIIFPNSEQFETYTYNDKKDCFIFGFQGGQIGMGKVSNSSTIESFVDQIEERRYMNIDKIDIDPDSDIIELFVDENDLYIITDKHLFKCLIVSYNKITKIKKLATIQSINQLSPTNIYDYVFRANHKKLYIYTYKEEEDNAIFLVQIDLQEGTHKWVKVQLDAHFFEIDPLDPDTFFFIEEKVIYKMDFSYQEKTYGFFNKKVEEEKEKNLYGAEEFYQSKFDLDFIRFAAHGKFFFINEGKVVKAVDSSSFDVIKTFDQQKFLPTDILFNPEMDFIYTHIAGKDPLTESYHFNKEILIWNFEREQLLSVLNGDEFQPAYTKPMILNEGRNMAVLNPEGIHLWQLQQPQIETTLSNKSGFARMNLLDDGEHLMLDFKDGFLFLLEMDTFRIIRKIKLPRGTRMYRQLGDSDLLLVLKNKDYDTEWANKQKLKLAQDQWKKHNPLGGSNMPTINKVESPGHSEEELKDEIENVLRKNLVFGDESEAPAKRDSNQQRLSSVNDFSQIENGLDYLDLPGAQRKQTDELSRRGGTLEEDADQDDTQSEDALSDENENNLFLDDDDDDFMSAYRPNNAENQKDPLVVGTTLTPKKEATLVRGFETKKKTKKNRRKEYVMIKTKEGYKKEEIRSELYKYRLVRVVVDEYNEKVSQKIGIYTLLQTDKKIINLDTVDPYEQNEEQVKSKKKIKGSKPGSEKQFSKFRRLQSRVKSNIRAVGDRYNSVLVALTNRNVYKIDYETDDQSRVKHGKVWMKKMFHTLDTGDLLNGGKGRKNKKKRAGMDRSNTKSTGAFDMRNYSKKGTQNTQHTMNSRLDRNKPQFSQKLADVYNVEVNGQDFDTRIHNNASQSHRMNSSANLDERPSSQILEAYNQSQKYPSHRDNPNSFEKDMLSDRALPGTLRQPTQQRILKKENSINSLKMMFDHDLVIASQVDEEIIEKEVLDTVQTQKQGHPVFNLGTAISHFF